MGRRRGSSYYDDYYYEPSRPLPADGIKAKGTFGESWWAKRWIKVLESFGIGTRLARGRSYARNGQVLNIEIKPGRVDAKVQGSRATPYKVKIEIPTLSDAQWEAAVKAMSGQAIFAAKLLAGEMPREIEDAFILAQVPLFPSSAKEINTDCSCPDWSFPCKHGAAVYYLLGERFDEDPFLIFQLRGRTQEQIVEALWALRNTGAVADEAEEVAVVEPAPALGELMADFYGAGQELERITVHIEKPEIDGAVLKRLGAPPAETEVDLRVIYGAMSRWVQDKVFGE